MSEAAVAGGRGALRKLANELRTDAVIAPHVRDTDEEPALGRLVASGPRASEGPAEYALLFEAIREGFLLHYASSRLLDGADPDLRLLAGDYLYALGLERLAARGDLEAVSELADLISLSAQLHARDSLAEAEPLWLASAVAVGTGVDPGHGRAKQALRDGDPDAAAALVAIAAEAANRFGMRDALARAADSIGFGAELSDRG